MARNLRQNKILELISTYEIEKQDELDNTAELIHLPKNTNTNLSEKTRAEIA